MTDAKHTPTPTHCISCGAEVPDHAEFCGSTGGVSGISVFLLSFLQRLQRFQIKHWVSKVSGAVLEVPEAQDSRTNAGPLSNPEAQRGAREWDADARAVQSCRPGAAVKSPS